MTRRTTSLLLPILVLSLLTVGVGVAVADDTFHANSRVTIHYKEGKDRFQGHVHSGKPSCERKREVKVYKDKPGCAPSQLVGTDRTNDNGLWKVSDPNAKGDFFARVQRRERNGGTHVCRGDRSGNITVN